MKQINASSKFLDTRLFAFSVPCRCIFMWVGALGGALGDALGGA